MVNTIVEYLKHSAKAYPDKKAFRDNEKSVSFSELDKRARLLACVINHKLGGRLKQPIGVYLPKSVDCVVAFMAVLYSGNYYTPLDISMPKIRLEKIMAVLEPAVVVTNSLFSKSFSCETVLIDENCASSVSVEDVIASVIDTDTMYVMFTSGSTGDPKGVIISHRAVIDYIDWVGDTFGIDDKTVFGNQAPFSFDNSVLDIYCAIKYGAETVIIPEDRFMSGGRLCSFVEEYNINAIFWVPTAMALVANSGALEKRPLTKLTKILFAGEVMPTKHLNVWRRFIPDALYANLYGPTEIAVDCTYYIVDRDFSDAESLPIGIPCRNSGVLLLNENDELTSEGEIGELCVRGSCLASGYYKNPQKTLEVFVQNPLNDKYPERIFRTGDLVKYNGRGELLYCGRKDFQIKHHGYRIELGEIETAASSTQSVDQCCAVYDDERKRIVLVVTPEDVDKKALYAHLKKLIPGYMLPGLIVAEKDMPLNQNAKIDRLALMKKLDELR